MSNVLQDWNKLDKDHKQFILRVRMGNGAKHAAEPHYKWSDDTNHIKFWALSEDSGFVRCTGTYKWVVTDKFNDLESELFGVKES